MAVVMAGVAAGGRRSPLRIDGNDAEISAPCASDPCQHLERTQSRYAEKWDGRFGQKRPHRRASVGRMVAPRRGLAKKQFLAALAVCAIRRGDRHTA